MVIVVVFKSTPPSLIRIRFYTVIWCTHSRCMLKPNNGVACHMCDFQSLHSACMCVFSTRSTCACNALSLYSLSWCETWAGQLELDWVQIRIYTTAHGSINTKHRTQRYQPTIRCNQFLIGEFANRSSLLLLLLQKSRYRAIFHLHVIQNCRFTVSCNWISQTKKLTFNAYISLFKCSAPHTYHSYTIG